MPNFEYRAKDGPEKLVEGVIEAVSESAAIEKVNQMGFVPVLVRARIADVQAKEFSQAFVSARKRRRQVILFSRHMASLIKSGVSVLKALWVHSDQEKDPGFKHLLESLANDIKEGKTLSQAMEQYPAVFSTMYVSILRAGEGSGALQEALMRMADYLKKQEDLRSKVKRALAYPLLLLIAGTGTLFYILTFVVPKLTRLFTDIGQELPWPTKIIVALGNFMNNFWVYIVIAVLAAILMIPRILKKYLGDEFFDGLKLSLPFFGALNFKTEFVKFSRTLQMSLSHGIPFLDSIRVALPALSNKVLASALQECYLKVEKGETFGASLKQSAYFPDFVTNLVSIGEESGRLEEVLLEITQDYEQEVDDALSVLTTLLEPAMILTMGIVIGFIVIAMLMPIFEMNTVF